MIISGHDQIHMYTQKDPNLKKQKKRELNLFFFPSLKLEKGAYFLKKKKKIPHLIFALIREPSLSVLTAD